MIYQRQVHGWSPSRERREFQNVLKSLAIGSSHQALERPTPSALGSSLGLGTWALSVLLGGLCALPKGSEQQAQPVVFLPLRFLQSAEGNLGSLSEDVLYILPKLGRTFQVEGSSDLFAGTLTLGGGRGWH